MHQVKFADDIPIVCRQQSQKVYEKKPSAIILSETVSY
jgi:hypothetical protein